MKPHCDHWQNGDGDCHHCGASNWCPEDGETPEALEDLARRENQCPDGEETPNAVRLAGTTD